jgi:putative restriction endonuclease
MSLTTPELLDLFTGIRRAQRDGRFAPHKPLLLLLALARVQQGLPRLTSFESLEPQLKSLLATFAHHSALSSRHYPYWHLHSDGQGRLWEIQGPPALLQRASGATPNLGELKQPDVLAGFAADVDARLRADSVLLQQAAQTLLDAYFPSTLHEDIAAIAGLDLSPIALTVQEAPAVSYTHGTPRRRRDPAFRERVLRAYEYRCCVCGFDLRIDHMPAGLEAAHIRWHTYDGPDIESNGLSLCALHHKLFDLGVFTLVPNDWRIVFSQHAIGGGRSLEGELRHHGAQLLPPQDKDSLPAPSFVDCNHSNVFKKPQRAL